MSIREISDKVNSLGNAWESFKHVNDARLSEIEKKGSADPLYMEQLTKINNALDNQKSRLEQMEIVANRPIKEIKSFGGIQSGIVSEYKKAFDSYLRKGNTNALDNIELKALSVGSDPDGGYLVTPTLSQRIEKIVFEASPMRQLASIEEISTDSLDIIVDNDSAAAGWTTETGSVSDSNTPQIHKESIAVHEMYAQPKATQKLIDDSAIDIEAWIAEKVAEIFSTTENAAFINGNGSGKPLGILQYTAGTSWGEIEQINSESDGAVTADSLVNLYYSLKDEYAKNATFLMNRSVMQAVRLLKESTTDQYIWQPGLAAGAPDTLLGVPVAQATDMPVAASDSLSVALGDFKRGYKIVDRIGMRVLRDPFTDKPFVKFYTTKRVGGEVVNFEAIKLLKLAVTA
ncbi:MAG: phage major capsid protein [Alphaproteobacteria bacterium CG11_big_fil_rev_8_21_14_0_20_44_7]|nr:MAG: phage major capsid protein [Alphaproteobacteria bacterium CG11_big_fil_rev_8_21_14_0_20_44_7]